MEEKIYKPNSCLECPAMKRDIKNQYKIICGCMKILNADTKYPEEMKKMWDKCPIAWDKPEDGGIK